MLNNGKREVILQAHLAKNRVSDNVGGVKLFLSTLGRALVGERHFALVDGFALPTVGSLRNRFQVRNSVRPMHLFDPQLRS